MKTKLTTLLLGASALALFAVAPLVAHHAFGAEFDRDAPILIQGKITRLEWVNPHTWVHIETTMLVKASDTIIPADPSAEVWAVEGGTPNTLLRRGLRRDCLTPGTEVIVDGYQTKDHSIKRANGRDITFADGAKVFLGSSGTGAPYEAEIVQARQNEGRC
ncbi:MAG: DUF6152 family protein [Gemmatimonadota bacterium]|nr:DUF6152 family protein [Gemmatimonadota bacterium]MDH3423847.1 DUF6152 family protein [Gemmatimonadota bacterium]